LELVKFAFLDGFMDDLNLETYKTSGFVWVNFCILMLSRA